MPAEVAMEAGRDGMASAVVARFHPMLGVEAAEAARRPFGHGILPPVRRSGWGPASG